MVIAGDSVVAESSHLLSKLGFICNDHPAFARRYMLDRMKAEDRKVSKCAYVSPVELRSDRMTGIRNKDQAMRF
jgi:hypothetical protein